MIKIKDILPQKEYKIVCIFNTGEKRLLDLKQTLDQNDKYAKKIFNKDVFYQVKLGEFGEIYWDGIAEIIDLDGNPVICEYDISPEFAYNNSIPLS